MRSVLVLVCLAVALVVPVAADTIVLDPQQSMEQESLFADMAPAMAPAELRELDGIRPLGWLLVAFRFEGGLTQNPLLAAISEFLPNDMGAAATDLVRELRAGLGGDPEAIAAAAGLARPALYHPVSINVADVAPAE